MTGTRPRPAPVDLLPRHQDSRLVVAPPDEAPGSWAGAPTAVLDGDDVVLAYRLRTAVDRGYANVVARSPDGVTFGTVAVLGRERFGGESLERPR